jgi:hypothetical protein
MVYQTAAIPYIYNMYGSNGWRYDAKADSWTALSTAEPLNDPWFSGAPIDDSLYFVRSGNVFAYNTTSDAWSTVASVPGADDYNMSESDENGVVYGYDASSGDIIGYDTVSDTTTSWPTGLSGLSEARLGYDPGTRAMYFGAYPEPYLYKLDLTSGVVTSLKSISEYQLSDIFCSDRSGHIYVAGDSSGTTMWQYDIASDTWNALPDLPSEQSNNGSCTVSEDGYLYVGTGSYLQFYRLALTLR